MLVNVRVIPNARQEKVVTVQNKLRAYVNAPAADGKANNALIALLASTYKTKKQNVKIVSGFRSREKLVEIENK